jgi:hypothetical protein
MNRAIGFLNIAFITLLISSCALKPTATVTVYNTTRVTTGYLEIVYGNYEKEYADGSEEYHDVSFPFTVTIPEATVCANYIVIAELEDWSAGMSRGVVFIDTRAGPEIEATIDLMLYIVRNTDDYEPDDDFDSAGVIQVGEYQARSLIDTADVDYVSFYAVSGKKYVIETRIHEGSQTNFTLYDPGRTQFAYDDSSGDDGGSKITWLASYTGVCYIKVDTSYWTYYRLMLYRTHAENEVQAARQKYDEWMYGNIR